MAAEFIRHSAVATGLCVETVCCHAATPALQAMRSRPVHLGIFGLSLPDMDGLDLVAIALKERIAFRVLIVSGRRDEHARHQMRPGRIDGFFDAEADDFARLPEAIGRVAEGGMYFSGEPRNGTASSRSAAPRLDQMFTAHELRVFAALGDGRDDGAAAQELGLNPRTVHGHRQKIMSKLGVHSRADLMREAIRRGITRITTDRILRPGFECECDGPAAAPAIERVA